MQGMTNVTARHPRVRGTGKLVFRNDATEELWVVEREYPDKPLHAKAFKTSGEVTAFVARNPRTPDVAPKVEPGENKPKAQSSWGEES
jgi:hypothetical protein